MKTRPTYATRAECEADSRPYSSGDWLFLISLFGVAVVIVTYLTLGLMASA